LVDQKIGPAADTYALGCVLCEMLIGEPPYTGSTAQAILGKIITHEPRSAVDHRTSVPANVDSTIRRALEKLPADRVRDGREFARALADRAFRHGEFAVGAVGVGAGLWRMVAMGLGATTIVLGGLLIWAFGQESEGPPRAVERLLLPFPIGQEPRSKVRLSPDGSLFV
jgi:hypothetical protein